jgi:hypothetical protein
MKEDREELVISISQKELTKEIEDTLTNQLGLVPKYSDSETVEFHGLGTKEDVDKKIEVTVGKEKATKISVAKRE